ncbi:hypothetical protein [Demequina capsici]|uniref:Uncharacterized protein n=1 Tax=Demequina capsici TaxID=3075620 RepID=A0AA96FA25_9MICO|nr:hypothetical protein [Demequina sp. OYTSA14]WNM24866.1 hypothetical protein RN606_01575 [Demequina sp. OYTSA14]
MKGTRQAQRRSRPRARARVAMLGVLLALTAVVGLLSHHAGSYADHQSASMATPAAMQPLDLATPGAHPSEGTSCEDCSPTAGGAALACATVLMLLVILAVPRLAPRPTTAPTRSRRRTVVAHAAPTTMPRLPDLHALGISRT